VIDVDYNPMYMNLCILGHYKGEDNNQQLISNRYLAQIAAYDPSYYAVKLMEDVDFTWYYPNTPANTPSFAYYSRYLGSINYNNATWAMNVSGGDVNGDAYLVEAFDLTAGDCEPTLNVFSPAYAYTTGTVTGIQNSTLPANTGGTITTSTTYSINTELICEPYSSADLSEIQSQALQNTSNNAAKMRAKQNKSTPVKQINIINRQFIINKFCGFFYRRKRRLNNLFRLANKGYNGAVCACACINIKQRNALNFFYFVSYFFDNLHIAPLTKIRHTFNYLFLHNIKI
jgi:hypothetical protein